MTTSVIEPENTEIFKAFFDYAPDAIVVVNEQGEIVRVNHQVELLFGYDRQELLGRSVELLLPDRFKLQHVAHRASYMAESRLRPMGADLELFGRRKDGKEIAINIMLSPIAVNDHRFVISVIRDITQQKEFEETLRQSESRFRALFEQAPYALFLNTLDDKIVDVNPAACQLMGYTRYQLLNMRVTELQAPEVRIEQGYAVQQELTQNDFIETINLHRDGWRIPVEVRTTRLVWQDQELILSIVRDITERKEAEAQLHSSLQEKEVMLKEIHHRVKNNLQIVSSLLKLQAEYIEDPKRLDILQDSQNRVRAMALVHETLYQSKDLARINFAQYLEQLVNQLQKAYGSTPVEVVITLAVEPFRLDLDTAVSCGLIINELVSNALKYAFPIDKYQTGEIMIRFQQVENQRLILEIQDSGVGFPVHVDFQQTDTLGLQLVNTLVTDELDGEIELVRHPGTLFIITFPIPELSL